jgi:hypothetical protein
MPTYCHIETTDVIENDYTNKPITKMVKLVLKYVFILLVELYVIDTIYFSITIEVTFQV